MLFGPYLVQNITKKHLFLTIIVIVNFIISQGITFLCVSGGEILVGSSIVKLSISPPLHTIVVALVLHQYRSNRLAPIDLLLLADLVTTTIKTRPIKLLVWNLLFVGYLQLQSRSGGDCSVEIRRSTARAG